MTVGRVGRPHGRDGSFHVEAPEHAFPEGAEVELRGRPATVERRAGTAERPLVRISGVETRDQAAALRGEPLVVDEAEAPLEEGEWLVGDLVGSVVDGLGRVRRVLAGPSCEVLELEDGTLVPFVSDAVRSVEAGRIEVDRAFLEGSS